MQAAQNKYQKRDKQTNKKCERAENKVEQLPMYLHEMLNRSMASLAAEKNNNLKEIILNK